MSGQTREKVLELCKVLYDKKAQDILAIDVVDKTIIAEWFIVCSGRTTPQVKALCEEVNATAPELGLEIRRREGYAQGRWIVIDFGHILMHIFHPEERKYYNIERLWIDDPDGWINYSAQFGEE